MKTEKIICIVGRNGSGKTHYVDELRKQWASDTVRYVAFGDAYGASTDKNYYLQLRWNQHDIDEETPTVGQLLERSFTLTGIETPERREMQSKLYSLFQLNPLLDKYIILLSSGELRKYQLTKTLLANPKTLILDNPFIGLDAETRVLLKDLLLKLATEWDITIYLVLSRNNDVPPFAGKIIDIDGSSPVPQFSEEKRQSIVQLPTRNDDYQAETVIEMHKVGIRYGEHIILKDLDWTVRNGERWALSGQNGSGKSTLLSLICADNPQSYACDITLFGFRRGSGESIWDIKRHIGYVSPEMHRSYRRALPCINVVASGLKDTIGLYVHPTPQEKEQCRWWMRIFGVESLANRLFTAISSGEQRLVLLARAFVKDPELLILDEPLHGLDSQNRQMVLDIINTFCQRLNKTLIMVTHYEEELPECITHKIKLIKQ